MDIKPETIKTSIEALLRLQEIDGQVFKLNAELKNPPGQYQELRSKLDDAQKSFKTLDRVFRDADRERRALELRNLTLKDDIKRAESKRRDVRNTKEEFSANKEYETFQKKAAENEKIFEEKTKLAADKASLKEEKQKLVSDLETELKTVDEKFKLRSAELSAEIKTLEAQRESYISLVDDQVFSLYERVQRIRKGNGIALVKGLNCGGCFVSIPPQLRAQLERLEDIITCPSCSRILYPTDIDTLDGPQSVAS